MHSQGCGKMHIFQTREAKAIKRSQTRHFPRKRTRRSLQISHRFRGKINRPCGKHTTVIRDYLYTGKNICCQDVGSFYVFSTGDGRVVRWNHEAENEMRSFKCCIKFFSYLEQDEYMYMRFCQNMYVELYFTYIFYFMGSTIVCGAAR